MSTAPLSLRRLNLACALLAGLAASFASQAETTLERIQSTGTVRIGYANEAPSPTPRPPARSPASRRRSPPRCSPPWA